MADGLFLGRDMRYFPWLVLSQQSGDTGPASAGCPDNVWHAGPARSAHWAMVSEFCGMSALQMCFGVFGGYQGDDSCHLVSTRVPNSFNFQPNVSCQPNPIKTSTFPLLNPIPWKHKVQSNHCAFLLNTEGHFKCGLTLCLLTTTIVVFNPFYYLIKSLLLGIKGLFNQQNS